MRYKVFVYKEVDKYLDKLPEEINKRINEKIQSLKIDPFDKLEKFVAKNIFKLRIGDYRALVEVERDEINIKFLGHRSKIYKRYKK